MALVRLQPASGVTNNHLSVQESLARQPTSAFTSLYPQAKAGMLLKYVEGYPWTVNYYGQIATRADTVEHVDPYAPALTQPYYEVKGAVLQVSSPLSNSYEESTGVSVLTGSAIMPFQIVPHIGDVFIAQADANEDAVFVVHSVERKSHRKETLYEVQYQLYTYLSANVDFMPTLQAKVQETYHFNSDTNYFNRDLLLTSREHQAKLDLKTLIAQSQAFYFDTFVPAQRGMLLLPGAPTRCYDPFLVSFLMKTVSHEVMPAGGISTVTVPDFFARQQTIWNVLQTCNIAGMRFVNRTMGFVGVHQLRNMARLGTAFHVGLDYVAHPKEPATDALTLAYRNHIPQEWYTGYAHAGNSAVANLQGLPWGQKNGPLIDLLPPLFEGEYYVVSERFYRFIEGEQVTLSLLESLVIRFLQHQSLPREDMVRALRDYPRWSALHQLYWLPVLWFLCSAAH